MTFRLGLTGSIGMGKSTTAGFFAEAGCEIWDADAAVHRLYAPGGPAIAPVAALVPQALQGDVLDREALRAEIRENNDLLTKIEKIVHPLVKADREMFLAQTKADIAVLDIPLLFETGSEQEMDAVACVTISAEIQKQRVLDRGTMSASDLELILSRQMPIKDKVAKADYVIETDTPEHAKIQVARIVRDIRQRLQNA